MITALRRHWVAILLGAGAALGHAPWSLWPLTILCFIGFFWWNGDASVRGKRAQFQRFWFFGFVYFAVSMSWIIEPFLVDAAAHGWMAPFVLVFMAGGLAVFWGLAGLAHPYGGAFASASALGVAEWMRGHVLTGFPWGMPAYGVVDTGFIQWFAILGPYGVTIALFLISALIAVALRARKFGWIAAATCAGAIAVALPLLQAERTDAASDYVVRLIQPNAQQSQKWDPQYAPIFYKRLLDATADGARPDLIIWPESAIAALLNYAPDMIADIEQAAGETPVVFGALRFDEADQLKNALVLLQAGAEMQIYDKSHLVPFGEYLPLESFLRPLGLGFFYELFGGAFTPGPAPRVLELYDGKRFLPLICYELIFPNLVRGTNERPDFIVQITNDAWFGTVSGPYQHLAQARARAVENGVPVVRVANTGVSAVIAPDGLVTAHLPLDQFGVLNAYLPVAEKPTVYARLGDIFVPIFCLIGLLLAWIERRNKNLLTFL